MERQFELQKVSQINPDGTVVEGFQLVEWVKIYDEVGDNPIAAVQNLVLDLTVNGAEVLVRIKKAVSGYNGMFGTGFGPDDITNWRDFLKNERSKQEKSSWIDWASNH